MNLETFLQIANGDSNGDRSSKPILDFPGWFDPLCDASPHLSRIPFTSASTSAELTVPRNRDRCVVTHVICRYENDTLDTTKCAPYFTIDGVVNPRTSVTVKTLNRRTLWIVCYIHDGVTCHDHNIVLRLNSMNESYFVTLACAIWHFTPSGSS